MKVLFTFGGIPHYLNAMLNKIQAKGADITVVSPRKEIGRASCRERVCLYV